VRICSPRPNADPSLRSGCQFLKEGRGSRLASGFTSAIGLLPSAIYNGQMAESALARADHGSRRRLQADRGRGLRPLGITRRGWIPSSVRTNAATLEALRRLLAHYQIQRWWSGCRLRLSGAEGTQSKRCASSRMTCAAIRRDGHLWDERWTSTEPTAAPRTDCRSRSGAKAVDRMAATLILQSWLEAHR